MDTKSIYVPHELFKASENATFSGTIEHMPLEASFDKNAYAQDVTWDVDVSDTGDALLVKGNAHGTVATICSRCLSSISFPVSGTILSYYLLEAQNTDSDSEEDDEFEVLGEDHMIDIAELARTALLIEIPFVPLCSDTCKGLCPQCGANLNNGPCSCERAADEDFEQLKNPFSVLRNFDFDGGDTPHIQDNNS